MKKFDISVWTQGFVRLTVDAEDETAAWEKANELMEDADFGPLEDIEWEKTAVSEV